MILSLDPSTSAQLLDDRNFRALKVTAPSGIDLSAMLAPVGTRSGDHVWLSVQRLKEMGPVDADWSRGFDAMIAYADEAGWVSADKTLVRAHLEFTAG